MVYIENINLDGDLTAVIIIGVMLVYFFRKSSKK